MNVNLNGGNPTELIGENSLTTSAAESVAAAIAQDNLFNPPSNPEPLNTKKVVKRCDFHGCKKRIDIVVEITGRCRCEKTFCPSHLPSIVHKCEFDYKEAEVRRLQKQYESKKSGTFLFHPPAPGNNHAY